LITPRSIRRCAVRTFALSPIARQLIPALHASIAAHWTSNTAS
jgi:hypothetical protein